MKSQILLIQGCLLAIMVLLGVACAKKGDDAPPPAPPGDGVTATTTTTSEERDTDTARGAEWLEGATAPLEKESLAVLNEYAISHPVNAPTDLRISVKTNNVGGNRYAGRVMISYFDNSRYYTASFTMDDQTIPDGYSDGHKGKNYAEYNKWFKYNGKNVFHGFFADTYGAVMLVVTNSLNQGDGVVSEYMGEIWFKNFEVSRAGQGYIPCQFIEIGPYDCRTFLTSKETLDTTSALKPSQSTYGGARGWKKLGTFSGLKPEKAFGSE